MPAELAAFSAILPAGKVLHLVETYGGGRIYVPRRVRHGQVLSASLGIEAARALSAEFGGQQLKVPMCKWWRARVYGGQGVAQREISRRLGLSEAAVYRHLQSAPLGASGQRKARGRAALDKAAP